MQDSTQPHDVLESRTFHHGDHVLTLDLALVDGRAEVVRFEMTSSARSPITATALRSVRLAELASTIIDDRRRRLLRDVDDPRTKGQRRRQARKVTAKMAAGVSLAEDLPVIDGRPDNARRISTDARTALDAMGDPRRAGRPPIYRVEHYAQVAAIYRSAAGRKPVEAVRGAMNVSRSTASGWVRRCRELGLLGPTDQRRAGERRIEGQ